MPPRRCFVYTGFPTCAHCGCAVTVKIKAERYIYDHRKLDKATTVREE